jgi:acyl-coenzyme A synthetase/AMP-(fatty) acid ligase
MSDPTTAPTPERYNFARDVVDRWARDEDKLALLWADERLENQARVTFAEVARRSRQLARALQARGHAKGERVALAIGRDPEWWHATIGLIRGGFVAVPGTTQLTPKDYEFRIGAAGISAIIADEANARKVETIRARCPGLRTLITMGDGRGEGLGEGWIGLDEIFAGEARCEETETRSSDPCLIYFTSGTTGAPKMVLHTHVSYPLGHRVTGRTWLGLGPDDLHWNLSDTGWAKAAWSSLFGPWSQGAAVFAQRPAAKFDAQATLETLAALPITTFCAPPTVYRALVTVDLAATPPRALRSCVAAGEPLNPEVIATWARATGITIRDGYGQTETTILVGNFPGGTVKPGSMGLPAPGFEVDVIGDDLRPVAVGKEGDIAIRVRPTRPLGLFVEYLDNPKENADKFRGDYYITGDRAVRDEDGYLWFVGRADDVILSAGYRIGPFEVESALVEHPAVQEAAVVGAPDPERYQIVKAYVILAPGFQPSDALARELQEHVKTVTAPYKYPRRIEFVAELPKTISGKIRRVELRAAAS